MAGYISTRLTTNFNTTVNPIWRNEAKIQRLWEALLTVSRIWKKCYMVKGREELPTKMDPRLAQPPELAHEGFIVFLSVFRSAHSLGSLPFYP